MKNLSLLKNLLAGIFLLTVSFSTPSRAELRPTDVFTKTPAEIKEAPGLSSEHIMPPRVLEKAQQSIIRQYEEQTAEKYEDVGYEPVDIPVEPDPVPEPAPEPDPVVPPLPPEPKDVPPIDVLSFTEEDLGVVLKEISEKSGLNIVTGPGVSGRVSIFLQNINPYDALRVVLDVNNLAYFEENGVIRVMTPTEYERRYGKQFGDELETEIITMTNILASDLKDALNEMAGPRGKVIFNDQTNSFILIEKPEVLQKMVRLIREADVPVVTESFTLKHARAENLAGKIRDMLTPNAGKLKFDKESNKLIVTDTEQKMESLRTFITREDQTEREFRLRAKIIQIMLNEEHTRGVDWEAIVSDFQQAAFVNSQGEVIPTEKREKEDRFFAKMFRHQNKENPTVEDGNLAVGTVSAEDFIILLEALETVGIINEISDVETSLKINSPAEITLNAMQVSSTGESEPDKNLEDAGENVRFHVNIPGYENERFTLTLRPEVVTKDDDSAEISVPREEVTVTLKDGATVVIGGLFKNVAVEDVRKIPLLGDLPFLGVAFRNEERKNLKTEIITFLSFRSILKETAAP